MFQRKRKPSDFGAEIEAHLQHEAERLSEQGLSAEEAQTVALRAFGNVTRARERFYESDRALCADHLRQDLRFGLRMLIKHPGFTIVAVLTLAIGIGANTAIFSVINAVLLRPFPFRDADRLLMIWQKDPKVAGDDVHISGPDYSDWRELNDVFSGMAAYSELDGFEMIQDEQVVEVSGLLATSSLLTTVDTPPVMGRGFTEEEEKTGEHVVLISEGFRHKEFGDNRDVLGSTLMLNAEKYKVIGVLPAGFRMPWVGEFSVLAPLPLNTGVMHNREQHRLHVIARIRSETSRGQAEANFQTLDHSLGGQRSEADKKLVARFGTLIEDNRDIKASLLVLMGAVAFVLLIACGNVANLLLSRGVGRRKEFAIRCAIGASRLRVARQLVTEGLLLGTGGCVAGMALAACSTPFLATQAAQHFRNISGISMDVHVAGFAILISLLTVVLVSAGPAVTAVKPDMHRDLKEGGSLGSTSSRGQQKIRGLLVSMEVALALVVLIGAGLLIRDFLNRSAVETGFHIDHILTAEVHLKGATYDSVAATTGYYKQTLQRLEAIPAVTAVSVASALPVGHGEVFFVSFAIPGQQHEAGEEASGLVRLISPGYFDVLGLQLIGGRDFTGADSVAAERVAMVNQTFVQRYLRGENPIGKSLLLTSKLSFHTDNLHSGPVRIVAVAPNLKHWCIGCEPHSDAEIYLPFAQAPARDMILLLRYEPNAEGIASAVRRQLWQGDSTQGMQSLKSMSEQLSDAVHPFLFYPSLLGIFGLSALALACIGVYGILSYSVAERTHEIGIRRALGATNWDTTRMVLSRSGKLVAVGVVVGVVSALGLTRFLSHLLHGVSSLDPLTFVVIPALLMLVAATAAYLPARRAGKIDPIVALRSE